MATLAGFINKQLVISSQSMQIDEAPGWKARSDATMKTDLQHSFCADSVQLIRQRDGRLSVAKVTFLGDRALSLRNVAIAADDLPTLCPIK